MNNKLSTVKLLKANQNKKVNLPINNQIKIKKI